MKEKDVLKQVQQYLAVENRVPVWWRQNSGASRFENADGSARFVRFALPGVSDIIGMTSWGQFLAIELKAPGRRGNTTPDQKLFLSQVKKNGGIAIVAEDYSEIKRALDRLERRRKQDD